MKGITLAQARQGFRFTNQTENKSAKTIEWYDQLLGRFEAFMAARNGAGSPALAKIGVDDIRQFIAALQSQTCIWEHHPHHKPVAHPLSPDTIAGYVRALRAFFAWAVAEKRLTASPRQGLAKPKTPKTIKEGFRPEEVKRLLDACDQYCSILAQRNRAILLLLLDTGVRASELVTLTADRLDLEHNSARVTGKGSKDRYVLFGNTTAKALLYYLVERERAGGANPRIFLTREGGEMSVGTLQLMLRDLGKRANVSHCHPHRFRHTAARTLIRNGLNVFMLQQLLGHADLRTTRGYVALEDADLREAYQRMSPVDRWNLK